VSITAGIPGIDMSTDEYGRINRETILDSIVICFRATLIAWEKVVTEVVDIVSVFC
jgi:hypothetical protein